VARALLGDSLKPEVEAFVPDAFHALASPKSIIKSVDLMLSAFRVLRSLHQSFLIYHEGYLDDALVTLLRESCREVRKRVFEAANSNIGEEAAVRAVNAALQYGLIDEEEFESLTNAGNVFTDMLKRIIANELGAKT
jgi:hypothetical protein